MPRLRTTAAAVLYLEETHGIQRTPSYLKKLRLTGRGPLFSLFNNRPYYTDDGLDRWVEEGLSGPARSGVEHRNRRRRTGATRTQPPAP
jgi:hypothetical protein